MKKDIELFDKILDEFLNDGVNLGYPKETYKFTELYRNSIWLSKGIENSTEIRGKLSKTKSLKELKKELEIIFN
jgi:hypothetical protein